MELDPSQEVHHLETSGLAERWTLAVQGADSRDPWRVDGEIAISVTGRKVFRDVARESILVDVSVDVHRRAPLVTLSGICSLSNVTKRTLVMTDPTGAFRMLVGPGESRQAGVGGAFEVTLTNSGEGSGLGEPTATAIMPEDCARIDGDTTQWSRGGGYKFVLLQQGLVQEGLVRDIVLVCVPMLRVLNGMPCRILCGTACGPAPEAGSPAAAALGRALRAGLGTPRAPGNAPPGPQALSEVASGDIQGLDDIDPSQPIRKTNGRADVALYSKQL
ncbi:unnamed protein product [Prorocentrum cordatum]|uniref:Uncharacterized protein n=1 Tax=Prorocentrum cordatum TaxID=2364126 RepID=A0ABN9Y0B3_9DINO|nr:unnamed protein product [Polarella glacialis]